MHVQDPDEKAFEVGTGFIVGNAGVGWVPMPGDFMAPAGYNSRVASKRILEQYSHSLRPDALYGGVDAAGWDKGGRDNRAVVGSSKAVVKKVKQGAQVLGPGSIGVWTNDRRVRRKES